MSKIINLKIARMKKGMDQQTLADMIGAKSLQDISRYETDRVKPPIDKLCKMADILEVTTDYLLGRE